MHIDEIWVSQRNLNRAGQIPAMIETLKSGNWLPEILLSRTEDGSIQVEDGHHRLTAIWATGRRELKKWEYILIDQDVNHRFRPKVGKVSWLFDNLEIPG